MRWKSGFTLIELLVAMAMSGIVVSTIYSTYYTQQKSYTTQQKMTFMQQNLRGAMAIMSGEIMMAGYAPTRAAGTDLTTDGIDNDDDGVTDEAGEDIWIITASANAIAFVMDLNGDGNCDDTNEAITYLLADPDDDGDTDLARNTGGGNQLVTEDIASLTFRYLDQNGAQLDDGGGSVTASIADIRAVEISLTASTDDGSLSPRSATTRIRCRNLGL
jgi:type IV pilus assembly protein PilW